MDTAPQWPCKSFSGPRKTKRFVLAVHGIIIKVAFSGSDSCFSSFVRVKKNISTNVYSTAVLTIDKVSAKDFQATFTCIGTGSFNSRSKNITLIRRGEWQYSSSSFYHWNRGSNAFSSCQKSLLALPSSLWACFCPVCLWLCCSSASPLTSFFYSVPACHWQQAKKVRKNVQSIYGFRKEISLGVKQNKTKQKYAPWWSQYQVCSCQKLMHEWMWLWKLWIWLFILIDTRTYDAYVIYQMRCLDKATEEKLSLFITKILPSVLESKCGYRLFIHERDDIPGEGQLLILI